MSSQRPPTARARLVSVLTEEILQSPETGPFAIASEHQLCRQYNISRVTVRLALSDLENRGLIYRKHGKGTFAHGRTARHHRNLGILIRTPHMAEHRPIAEFARGIQTIIAPLRSGLLIVSTPPEEWRPEMASSLGGIIVLTDETSAEDLEIIRDRKVPVYILGDSDLSAPTITMGERVAARKLTEDLLKQGHRHFALMNGFHPGMDTPKRNGVHDALKAAGIDPKSVHEYSAQGKEGEVYRTAGEVLKSVPRPTAVVAFDDSLAAMLSAQARRQFGLKVPSELSIVSFHQWPYLNFIEPSLTTVRFDYFAAGQRAAEALNQAALTGITPQNLSYSPTYIAGQTVGPVPVS